MSMGTNGAALTNHDQFVDAVVEVLKNNRSPNAAIYHPRTAGGLAKLKDTDNNPLTVPDLVKALGRFTSTQIPINLTQGTSTDTSEAYIAQWDEAILGVRTNLRVEVLKERYADNLQFGFLAYLRADVGLMHSESFSVITGIRP